MFTWRRTARISQKFGYVNMMARPTPHMPRITNLSSTMCRARLFVWPCFEPYVNLQLGGENFISAMLTFLSLGDNLIDLVHGRYHYHTSAMVRANADRGVCRSEAGRLHDPAGAYSTHLLQQSLPFC